MMGGNIYMKAGVVPHKFDCQPDRKRAASGTERLTSVKRQRKQLVQEIIAGAESEKYKDDGNAVYALNIASTSAGNFKVYCISLKINDLLTKHLAVSPNKYL